MPTTMTMGTWYHFVPDALLKEEEQWINTDTDTEYGEQYGERDESSSSFVGPRESLRFVTLATFGSPDAKISILT